MLRKYRTPVLIAVCATLALFALVWVSTAHSPQIARADVYHQHGPNSMEVTHVLTDVYELNDTTPFNLGNYSLGISCASPVQIVSNASFYREPLTVNDIDLYSIVASGGVVYTLSVQLDAGQMPTTPINFVLQLFSVQSGTQVGAQTSANPSLSFFAPVDGAYRITLSAQNPNFEPRDQSYRVALCSSPDKVAVTSTPSPTPMPSATTVGAQPDGYEPNDTPAEVLARLPVVSYINSGNQIQNVNFYPSVGSGKPLTAAQSAGDVDWYFFYAKRIPAFGGTGGCYRIVTQGQSGVDTEIFVYRQPPADNTSTTNLIAANDDVQQLNRNSELDLAFSEDGQYWIKVWNRDPSPRGGGKTYNIALLEYLPTPIAAATAIPNPPAPSSPTPFPVSAPIQMQGKIINATPAIARPLVSLEEAGCVTVVYKSRIFLPMVFR